MHFLKSNSRISILLITFLSIATSQTGCTYHEEKSYFTISMTPLHSAILGRDSSESIEALVEKHPEFIGQHRDSLGAPTDLATSFSRPDVVAILLDAGADVNRLSTKSDCNHSLLHIAVQLNNGELVTLLLERGIDTSVRCEPHGTALDIARERGLSDLVELIETNDTGASGTKTTPEANP